MARLTSQEIAYVVTSANTIVLIALLVWYELASWPRRGWRRGLYVAAIAVCCGVMGYGLTLPPH